MDTFLTLPQTSFFSAIIILLWITTCESSEDYLRLREELAEKDKMSLLGESTPIKDPVEIQVNEILMKFKNKEFAEGLDSHGRLFPASKNFFRAKKNIESSNVYKIIKMLPKGGNLHTHLSPTTNVTFAIQNFTKMDHLHYCLKDDDHLLFKFSSVPIKDPCSDGNDWKLVKKLYEEASSEQAIEDWFHSSMWMGASLQQISNSDGKEAWKVFEMKIKTIGGLVKYMETYRIMLYKILQDHYEDNVMYLEMRSGLRRFHELDQTDRTPSEVLAEGQKVINKFTEDFPDSCGAKFIYAPHRFQSKESLEKYLKAAIELKKEFPSLFAGFDLVGYEEKGGPLKMFHKQFLEAAEQNVNFFFHTGETNWFGTAVDENLIDALLLRSKRIGHGFALYRHPLLYRMAKNQSIAVEVCPISNQALRQVEDMRVHPSASYFREGFPVVVGSDDAGLYGSAPLSHDMYYAFMAIGGQRADLRFLKQLAKNSLEYSAMEPAEKNECMNKWNEKWFVFIDKVAKEFGSSKGNSSVPCQPAKS